MPGGTSSHKGGCSVSSCCFYKTPVPAAWDCPLCASTVTVTTAVPRLAVPASARGLCWLETPGIISLFPQHSPVQEQPAGGITVL